MLILMLDEILLWGKDIIDAVGFMGFKGKWVLLWVSLLDDT